ncbi:MAG TPA: Maf family protein [Bryobacteraceae bacterium]|nr:Maf family protein [Bryobacteraceae bacterium]
MLVLASKSPRRSEILERAGIPFVVRAVEVPEHEISRETPSGYVRRLAREKALAVPRAVDEIVLGADTTVVAAGEILGKPADPGDSLRMLRLLSGREHDVLTGICLVHANGIIEDESCTTVHFVRLTDAEIEAYIASGEPRDKAGAYAIQGLASKFIDRITGDYFNVVGLPVALVYAHLRRIEAQMRTPG